MSCIETYREHLSAAPGRFVDEQVSGPFRRWHHAHHFEPDGTVMRDVVEFAAPLGRLAERLVLDRYLARLIQRRAEHLRTVAQRPS